MTPTTTAHVIQVEPDTDAVFDRIQEIGQELDELDELLGSYDPDVLGELYTLDDEDVDELARLGLVVLAITAAIGIFVGCVVDIVVGRLRS